MKVQAITKLSQLPQGDLYGVQATNPEEAFKKLQYVATKRGRKFEDTVFQRGTYFYGQFVKDQKA